MRSQAARAIVAVLAVLAPAALAPSALARAYYSPGYKGTTAFRHVAPAALPPISLGTGKYPNLLVDGAGTGHIVFAQDGGESAPDTLSFCNLQRGIKRCASSGLAPNPQAPDPSLGGDFAGNIPSGNHDFDGPVPLAIGNQLFVIERRFPDVFNTPLGTTSQSNVFEWSSVDGGATLTGPGMIGDNQMAGGAIAYGDPSAPSIGTISRTETDGTFFQGTRAGQYTGKTKAQLGSGDQAYDGALALDGTRPVAVFADLSGNVFVREWSGQGDANDAANWSTASFPGFSPQIVGGAAGVFVLSSNSRINGGRLSLRRIVGGQPAGAPVALGSSASEPAISEDTSGRISLAYTDRYGVEVRTSGDGVNFSTPQFTAAVAPGTIAHLVTAATADGGGFVSFVKNASGGEGVGQVIVSAFGTQKATGQPGLGPLPGGGIGSAAGDQLATSTCQSARFGVVDAEISPPGAGCYGHDPKNPNVDVSLGEVNINGLRIIPDPGVRIGIDPRLHHIDTTGKVRVVLSGGGIDITLWHDVLHLDLPSASPGDLLADFKTADFLGQPTPLVEGFPIDGDVDIKLVKGGVEVPISLKLPGYFGGVTGQATLSASLSGGLKLSSLAFTIGDANLGALELKDVDVSYTLEGKVWKGTAKLWVPAGGDALRASVAVEFDNGDFKSGSLDVGLPYPGVPLDDTDTPPQLYLSHVGLGLGLNPLKLSGTAGVGITPVPPTQGEGGGRDYVFSLDGELAATFGNPVTITLKATGFLYTIQLADGMLTYRIPNQVTLTGSAGYDLGLIKFAGKLGAIVDAKNRVFGGQISSKVTIEGSKVRDALCGDKVICVVPPIPDISIPSLAIAINNSGFGVYVPPPGLFGFFGTVAYQWGDDAPKVFPFQDMTGRFTAGIPQAASAGRRAHAAAAGFTVPAGVPTASLVVHGAGGAPAIALVRPDGRQMSPASRVGGGASVVAFEDASANATYVGIQHPRAGRWSVVVASGSDIPITGLQYSIGEPPPKLSGKVTGAGAQRTFRYRATLPANVTVRFAERTGHLLHVIGRVGGTSGTIRFRPAFGPSGRRALIAEISNNGVPLRTQTLSSFVVPRPPRPSPARGLRVRPGRRTFTFSFSPPANAAHTLLRIVATDGRHLQQIVRPTTRRGSLPVIGYRDGVTVTVIGLAADGSRGPAITASARNKR